MGCLLFTVVWYDFTSKQTRSSFLTIANQTLPWNQISNKRISQSMRKVRKLRSIILGILGYAQL